MKTKRLYKFVADDLITKIDSGVYSTGDRLPAERELASQYNVSRPTIREAVIALEIAERVEVRKGSGVYVTETSKLKKQSLDMDVGPFELTEARMMIEGEAAGLAATLITDEEISELANIIERMQQENEDNSGQESADKEFHMLIAAATRNSAIHSIIEDLWNLREKSELTQRIYKIARTLGVKPRIQEHWDIYAALKKHDPQEARQAMRSHLSRVIDNMFEVTEIEAVEAAKRRVSEDRERFSQVLKVS